MPTQKVNKDTVVAAYLKHRHLKQTGDELGITAERVRQIVKESGIDTSHPKKIKPPKPPKTYLYEVHGTVNCYQHGCRCDLCRGAHSSYHRPKQGRIRKDRISKGLCSIAGCQEDPKGRTLCARHRAIQERCTQKYRDKLHALPCDGTEPWHGTYGGYHRHGCRCDLCRNAYLTKTRQYQRDEYRRKKELGLCIVPGCKETASPYACCQEHRETRNEVSRGVYSRMKEVSE